MVPTWNQAKQKEEQQKLAMLLPRELLHAMLTLLEKQQNMLQDRPDFDLAFGATAAAVGFGSKCSSSCGWGAIQFEQISDIGNTDFESMTRWMTLLHGPAVKRSTPAKL